MSEIKKDLALFSRLAEYILETEEKKPVAERLQPEEAFQKANLTLENNPVNEEALTEDLKEIIKYTPKTSSKKFFNQLFGGRSSKAFLGDLLALMLNNSMYTYKAGGILVALENEIFKSSLKLAGLPQSGDGIMVPGGSMANLMALLIARDRADADIKNKGRGKSLTAYTSEDAHYSNLKNMGFAGAGEENLRKIKTDDDGRMDPQALQVAIREDIKNGKRPFLVIATAGTTVCGAFDPIDEIADICEKHTLHLHVDGAYCGCVIFSEQLNHMAKGLHRADTFCYNAHKVLGAPQNCSVMLSRNPEWLRSSFNSTADYLFQTDGDDFNPGIKSMQCGRRNDALKLWTLWKSKGTSGLGKIVEERYELSDYARHYIKNHKDYTLYGPDHSLSVCFNYKNQDPAALCEKLYVEEQLMVGHGSFKGDRFIRLVIVNPNHTKNEIDGFFQTLEKCSLDTSI